jgi:uncharacterized protein (DUF2235 family)
MSQKRGTSMPKTIVICCDGTKNSYSSDLTNVARVSLIARRIDGVQSVFYDAGVGVEAMPGLATRLALKISRWLGLAIGLGLVDNVKEAYLEIVRQYEPGARLFLFGFSRGAYTVRVLAGLLENFGLLKTPDAKLLDNLVERYQAMFPESERTFAEAQAFKSAYCVDCPIRFLGLWDTVSSVGWLYSPTTFPHTAKLDNVSVIRHALALDERRAKFRPNRVKPGENRKEVWFAGVHADVGGGYPEKESGLAKVTLQWMLDQASAENMAIDEDQVRRLVEGPITRPDIKAEQHESLKGFYWLLEYLKLPHQKLMDGIWIKEKIRYLGKGWRTVAPGDLVHDSVRLRMKSIPLKNKKWPGDDKVNWVT